MRVRFYGVRGSIPTPGASTLRYGGNTVCVEVTTADGSRLVLDAGSGIRELGKQIALETTRAPIHMWITHGHWDHILGLPFFGPVYDKNATIVLHGMTPKARDRLRSPIVFDGDHFPVRFEDLPAKFENANDVGEHRVGSARVRHIALNHPGGSTGFRIDDDDGTSLCYLTDNELDPPTAPVTTPAELARFADGATLMIHDAQYLRTDMPAKRGWGHSVVDEVLALARQANVGTLALHHHDPDRDDDALDAIATGVKAWAAEHAPGLATMVAREGFVVDL
jgi:phosphoribosyl 1,2-cyclic phosphodiesterase